MQIVSHQHSAVQRNYSAREVPPRFAHKQQKMQAQQGQRKTSGRSRSVQQLALFLFCSFFPGRIEHAHLTVHNIYISSFHWPKSFWCTGCSLEYVRKCIFFLCKHDVFILVQYLLCICNLCKVTLPTNVIKNSLSRVGHRLALLERGELSQGRVILTDLLVPLTCHRQDECIHTPHCLTSSDHWRSLGDIIKKEREREFRNRHLNWIMLKHLLHRYKLVNCLSTDNYAINCTFWTHILNKLALFTNRYIFLFNFKAFLAHPTDVFVNLITALNSCRVSLQCM